MIGLDISDHSVKLVQLSNTAPRQLWAHGWAEVPAGAMENGIVAEKTGLQRVLKKVLTKCRLDNKTKDPVVASIPEAQSFLRVVEIPLMMEDEVDEAVQWEVAQHFPFGLENIYIDWQPVAGQRRQATGQQEVLVGAVQKKVVDPLAAVITEMGFDLAALELEGQAIVRALVSEELETKHGLLLIDLGSPATNIIIHDQGAVRFTANLSYGARSLMAVLPAEQRQPLLPLKTGEMDAEIRGRVAGRLRAGQEKLVTEVKEVVEFYKKLQPKHEVREIILTGGGSNLPGLDSVFLEFFNDVHVQRGNPWVNVLATGQAKQSPLSLTESVHFSTAIGLALRRVEQII